MLTPVSKDTHARVKEANIEALTTDISLVENSDYILSIVPPRDALPTAKRITTAFTALSTPKPLYYLDLNAISPRSAHEIANLFNTTAPSIKFVDGGIIGGPPSPRAAPQEPSTTVSSHPATTPGEHAWNRPSIPVSGPHDISDSAISGAHLASTLNLKHISPTIGPASGLKCCFASTSKGFTALCIQAFTTASALGVLPLLQEELGTRMPALLKAGRGGVTGMPPKAYRWVREMEEIAVTHADGGGFVGGGVGSDGKGVFGEIAEVYRAVAEDTVLGEEKTERRKRGLSIEDVAAAVGEGLREKRKKVE